MRYEMHCVRWVGNPAAVSATVGRQASLGQDVTDFFLTSHSMHMSLKYACTRRDKSL